VTADDAESVWTDSAYGDDPEDDVRSESAEPPPPPTEETEEDEPLPEEPQAPPRTPSPPPSGGLPTPDPTPEAGPTASPDGWKTFSDLMGAYDTPRLPYLTARLEAGRQTDMQYLLSARVVPNRIEWRNPWGVDSSWHTEAEQDLPPELYPALLRVRQLGSHVYLAFDWGRTPLLDGLDFDRSASSSPRNPS